MGMVRRTKDAESEFFPGFTDVTEIGRGPLATVHRARDLASEQFVALKLLTARDPSAQAAESFDRDLAVLSRRQRAPAHRVAAARRSRAADGRPVLVLELCRGSIADQLQGRGLPVPQVVALGISIAGALETAHRADILHRNVKPQNILINEPGCAGPGRPRGGDAAGRAAHRRPPRLHDPARRARTVRGPPDLAGHRRVRARLVAVPDDHRPAGLPRVRRRIAGRGHPAHPARSRAAVDQPVGSAGALRAVGRRHGEGRRAAPGPARSSSRAGSRRSRPRRAGAPPRSSSARPPERSCTVPLVETPPPVTRAPPAAAAPTDDGWSVPSFIERPAEPAPTAVATRCARCGRRLVGAVDREPARRGRAAARAADRRHPPPPVGRPAAAAA